MKIKEVLTGRSWTGEGIGPRAERKARAYLSNLVLLGAPYPYCLLLEADVVPLKSCIGGIVFGAGTSENHYLLCPTS